jgi:hypothetical protein
LLFLRRAISSPELHSVAIRKSNFLSADIRRTASGAYLSIERTERFDSAGQTVATP